MTEIVFTKTSRVEELKEILVLQKENLLRADKINDQFKEGFVTVQHSLTDLQDMHNGAPHCIIKLDNKVIGYALVMLPNYKDKIEILKPFFNELEQLVAPAKKYLVMGQICIAAAYRGEGLFKMLYQYFKQEHEKRFHCVLTEVASTNTRSLQAHLSVGFEIQKTYEQEKITWHIMIWDWT